MGNALTSARIRRIAIRYHRAVERSVDAKPEKDVVTGSSGWRDYSLAAALHYFLSGKVTVALLLPQLIPAFIVVGVVLVPQAPVMARVLGLGAALVIFVIEYIVVFDRTITLFKMYLHVSVLLWLVALLLFNAVIERKIRWVVRCTAAIIGVSLVSGAILLLSITPDITRRVREANLDSVAPLLLSEREMGRLLKWMTVNVSDSPRILDAWGAGGLGRVTMNLGFPDFAHWEAHTVKRGVPHQELIRRRDLINEFYTSASPDRAYQILQENDIDYFVVSDTERRTYPEAVLTPDGSKFGLRPDLFSKIHQEGEAALFAPQKR